MAKHRKHRQKAALTLKMLLWQNSNKITTHCARLQSGYAVRLKSQISNKLATVPTANHFNKSIVLRSCATVLCV